MDNKQPDHGNGSPAGGRLGVPLILVLCDDDGDDDMTCLDRMCQNSTGLRVYICTVDLLTATKFQVS